MTERCNYLQIDGSITGYVLEVPDDGSDCLECLRPEGHEGYHLVQRSERRGGGYYAWKTIICEDCDCPCLTSFDWEDCCIAYGEVSEAEAQRMIDDPEYEG